MPARQIATDSRGDTNTSGQKVVCREAPSASVFNGPNIIRCRWSAIPAWWGLPGPLSLAWGLLSRAEQGLQVPVKTSQNRQSKRAKRASVSQTRMLSRTIGNRHFGAFRKSKLSLFESNPSQSADLEKSNSSVIVTHRDRIHFN